MKEGCAAGWGVEGGEGEGLGDEGGELGQSEERAGGQESVVWEASEFVLGFREGVGTQGCESVGVVCDCDGSDAVVVLEAAFQMGSDGFRQVGLDWLIVESSVVGWEREWGRGGLDW